MRNTLLRLGGAIYGAVVMALVLATGPGRDAVTRPSPEHEISPEGEHEKLPAALERKLAQNARFAPVVISDAGDSPDSFGEQNWIEHSMDGVTNGPPPFTAFATARNDWFGLLGRPANGTGKWVPYGPTNGQNDLTNVFRDRTVYTTGTENFGGRTVHAVISPDCKPAPGDCTLWIAASNGGVWRTDNALAADNPATPEYEGPSWEFVSATFEQQNTSSLELDPNDHKTLWAGTGEPNACGSGCEVGVGVYQSKDGRKGWRGPLGADVFFGRGVGSIEVKPGDSKTIFVATKYR